MSTDQQDGWPEKASIARRWTFGTAVLDEAALELTVNGQPAALERKSMMVLLHLLHHAGEVVTKEELFDAVWTGRVVTESVLTRCMSRIRAALGDRDQSIIKTVHGYGYRFSAELQLEQAGGQDASDLSLEPGDHPPLRPNWCLLRRLGSGGHGEVWLGEQPRTGEKRVYKFARNAVALSSLKREITLYRLLHESLGEDAGCVEILDWNLQQAPCYLECEYLPAGNLQDWSAAAGGLAGISLDERLGLIAQIADRLAAAHAIGVLHKDLKPTNVLVDATHEPVRVRLGDFGSGAVMTQSSLEHWGITRLGFTRTRSADSSNSGTPMYLAPELMTGQPATIQGDIYALGVMLYQAVAGDFGKPLAPGWENDVADPLLREDIAAAVDGEPQRRLKDASELARRLRKLDSRRRQRQQMEQARRRELRNRRLRRDLVRLRWAVMLTLLLALAASIAGTIAYRERNEAVAAKRQALSLRDEAQQARRESDEARAITEAVSGFMNEQLLGGMRRAPQPQAVNFETILEQAGARIDEVLGEHPAAAARVHMIFARRFVTRRDRSLGHLERAVALYGQAQGELGEGSLIARLTLAELQMHTGLFEKSLDSYQVALQALVRRYGETHPLVIAERARWHFVAMQIGPIAPHLEAVLAAPDALLRAGDPGDEVAWYLRNRHFSAEPDKARAHLVADARMHGCWALLRLRMIDAATEAICRESTRGLEELYGKRSLHALIPRALHTAVLIELGRLQEAWALLELYGEAVRPMSPQSFWRVFHRRNIGIWHLANGELDRALPLLQDAAQGCASFLNCDAIEVMYTYEVLADALLQAGDRPAAIAAYRRVLQWREAHQGEASAWTVLSRAGLIAALHADGQLAAAREVLDELTPAMLGGLPPGSAYRQRMDAWRLAWPEAPDAPGRVGNLSEEHQDGP